MSQVDEQGPSVSREYLNVVVVGHVDHGKSTVIGRLLADTGSLPEGKLEQVKESCRRTARPFEYAFLLDALKDEQAQGITIDTARCFFKTKRRDYQIIDAPGHIEFLRNMITGAARAQAALLIIDVHEGIKENSRRHGYLLSLLGINQVVVLVNKLDLIGYDQAGYDAVCREYREFLTRLSIDPAGFVPISARNGDNIASRSTAMTWYQGPCVVEYLDSFEKRQGDSDKPLRFPVQDVYKFTEGNDDRRIIAGTIERGALAVGDRVWFAPSRKSSVITSIEEFSAPARTRIEAGHAAGVTLEDELFIRPGELMYHENQSPQIGARFRATVFWLGKAPMIKNKRYKIKIHSARLSVFLSDIITVIDASDLSETQGGGRIERHDVADCVLETSKPVAFDHALDSPGTGRFVIIDNFEIAAAGVITQIVEDGASVLKEHVHRREILWDRGDVAAADRRQRFGHEPKFVVFTGDENARPTARRLERVLFEGGFQAYYLGMQNLEHGLDSDVAEVGDDRDEQIRRLGELARILTGAGQIFITALSDTDEYEIETVRELNSPNRVLVIGIGSADRLPSNVDLVIGGGLGESEVIGQVLGQLQKEQIIPDYSI